MAVSISSGDLQKLAPRGKSSIIASLVPPLNRYLPDYGIDTPLRVAHFLAQAAHEADSFKTLQEYASGAAYQGRKDLGNLQPGDGVRFKGRGIFQLTGRVNYQAYGKRLDLPLLAHPELAAQPEVSVRVACEYWKAKGLNAWADRDDVKEITRRINGGFNGLSDRKQYLAKAKVIFGDERLSAPPDKPAPIEEEVPDAPIAPERNKTGITEGGGLASIGTAADTLTQANDVVRTVNDTKENVSDLGVMDYVAALFSNPRFLISALVLVGLIGGLVYWQWKKHR